MTFRSKAPLRIGLAGGGTDVSPFSELYGGAILNTTVNLYANASITPRDDNKIRIWSVDRGKDILLDATDELDTSDGHLILQKGVYNRIVKDYGLESNGFDLITSIDVSAGSGLGTSSTLVVAILGAFVEWLKLPLGEYDIARLAYEIERTDLEMAGGKQDQYAATFGGFNFMEFDNGKVVVNPLRIKTEILHELEFHLILLYTHSTRQSARIIEEQRSNVEKNNDAAVEATKKLKEQAFMMKEALLRGNLADMGDILNMGWEHKKMMAEGITNPQIDQIYDVAVQAGASGGKISGAGGGGYMIFYCPNDTRYQVISDLEKIGVSHQHYSFLKNGLITWTSH